MDGGTWQLRPALVRDALSLSVLAMQVYLDTYATQGIRDAIARDVLRSFPASVFEQAAQDPGTRLWVAERQGHLLGFAQLTLRQALPTDADVATAIRPAELLRLYVQEPFTGRHLGTALLTQAEREAAKADCDWIWLTPWSGNARALAFYARRGYRDAGAAWYEIDAERHENRIMVKPLA